MDSIFSQTYGNFEIICVNDGSTDNSLKILESYKESHNNMRVISQSNKGLGEARNVGLEYVTGDYIWFVDSDDWIEQDALLFLSQFIEEHGEKDMILFDAYRNDGINKWRLNVAKALSGGLYSSLDYVMELLKYDGVFSAWIKIFKADIFLNSQFKFPRGFYEDIPLIKYYYAFTNSVGYVHQPLYNYYCRMNSIMKTYDNRVLDIYKQFEIINESLKDNLRLKPLLLFFFYYTSVVTRERVEKSSSKSLKDSFFKVWQNSKVEVGGCWKVLIINSIPLKRRIKVFVISLILDFGR